MKNSRFSDVGSEIYFNNDHMDDSNRDLPVKQGTNFFKIKKTFIYQILEHRTNQLGQDKPITKTPNGCVKQQNLPQFAKNQPNYYKEYDDPRNYDPFSPSFTDLASYIGDDLQEEDPTLLDLQVKDFYSNGKVLNFNAKLCE